jgi:hypothetical protein
MIEKRMQLLDDEVALKIEASESKLMKDVDTKL